MLSIIFVVKTKITIWAESTNGFSPFFFSFQKFYRTVINKYKVSYSSLFVVVKNGDKEKAEDLTRFAFANARNNPEEYREELKNMIIKSLK